MRLPFIFLLLTTVLNIFTACSDDEDSWMNGPTHTEQPQTSTRAAHYTSSLVQVGEYWRANQRVPLVGKGRIVDDLSNDMVSLLNKKINVENVVDEDLTNCISTAGLLGAEAVAGQIIAIKDINHIYAPNQKVGFIFKLENFSTLDLKVLKSFWVQTFLDDQLQDSFGSKEGTEVLELDLISVANNDEFKEISFMASKPFNKIQLNVGGVDAKVLGQNLSVYYAFVGENEIKTATAKSNFFPNAHLHKGFLWTNILNSEHIVDNDLTNYAYYGTLSGLLGDPHATVDFGKEVPAGSEVGFVISNIDVLNIGVLGSIILETYNENDEKLEHVSITKAVGLSVVKVGNHSRVSMKTTKPCTQVHINFAGLEIKLGGTNVYYAYACDPVTVDISSRFSASDVTISGNSYALPVAPGGTTTWQLISAPPGTLPEIITVSNEQGYKSQKIIGMTQDGDYRLQGIFTPTETSGEAATPVTIEFVIHRKTLIVGENCDQVVGGAGVKLGDIKGGGALISIGDIKNPENIIDNDRDSYATLISALGIAENVGIVAIDLDKPMNASEKKDTVRVGFTVRNTFDFLGANVLKFFEIRLYDGENLVKSQIVDNSKVGDVSLIGSKGHKIRMSIRCDQAFDHIELWKVGVVELQLSALHIYNVFWESTKDDCPQGDISEACMEMLTSAQGAEIDYKGSFSDGLLEVGGTYDHLSHLLDDNPGNHTTIIRTGAAGVARIAIKFPPLPKGSSIGFILADDGVATIEVLGVTTLKVYSNGTEVGSVAAGDLVKADLIGHTKRKIVEAQVSDISTSEFDEVAIEIANGVGALESLKIYGAFTRRDTDGNGIPDCAEDVENPPAPIDPLSAKVVKKHICEKETLEVEVTANGKPGETYTLNYWNTFTDNKKKSVNIVLPEDHIFRLPNLPAGTYFIRIEKEGKEVYSGALEAYVHPLLTTWKKDAQSTDWNTWSNWTEGAPWTCTDVILPTGCVRYPVLKQLPTEAQPDLYNYCANLHIESHAELVNTHLLDQYDYVWMELTLESGKNYILSSPLTNTVTGDYFVPAKWQGNHAQEHKFVRLTSTNSPENRFAPRVYQRCWSRDVPGKVLTDGLLGTTVITSETDWTAPFNAVAEPIREGMGWMVRAEDEGLPTQNLTFRFPKTHGDYSYFAANGANTGTSEGVYRDKTTLGQFFVKSLPLDITVNNLQAGATFVVGNPFAAHLNIAKFLEANKGVISEVKLTNGNGTHTVLYRNGEVTATVPGFTHIAPMQGFYVTAINPAQQLTLTFTEGMQEQKPGYNIYANGDSEPAEAPKPGRTRTAGSKGNELRILAVSGGKSTQCVVKLRADSRLDFYSGEDSRLLYDGENPPTVAVFTVAQGVATDIQQVPAAEARSIDVGWRMAHARDLTLHLSHEADSEWSGWALENRQTGQRIALDNPETMVKLGQQSTRVGGWRLVRE